MTQGRLFDYEVAPVGVDRRPELLEHLESFGDYRSIMMLAISDAYSNLRCVYESDSIEELGKTDKASLGNFIEASIKKHFRFDKGQHVDFSIGDLEFDFKCSVSSPFKKPAWKVTPTQIRLSVPLLMLHIYRERASVFLSWANEPFFSYDSCVRKSTFKNWDAVKDNSEILLYKQKVKFIQRDMYSAPLFPRLMVS